MTQVGKTLYSDLQRLLAKQRDTVCSLAEQALNESNPQLAHQLEAELKRIQKDFDKTFSEIDNLKVPFNKRLIRNLGVVFLSYSLICMNRDPVVLYLLLR